MPIFNTHLDTLSKAIRLATFGAVSLFSFQASAQSQIEEIVVTADGSQVRLTKDYAGGQVARGGRVGMFGNLDIMDTPFSSTNFTSELMLNQQAVSVADVLQNDPVVRVAKGFGNFQELYMIRGFPVYSDDMTYNGVYGILPRQFVASEFLERVEVFRGASAFLNGASPGGSGLGGAVNLVPKRAPEADLTRVSAGVESGGHAFIALDAARRFGANGEHGMRVNVVKRDGETSIADQERELSVFALGYDYSGDQLRLSLDMGLQDHRIDAPRPSVTPFGEIPTPPAADSNFAQPWTYTDEEQFFGVIRAEYDLNANTSAWLAAGMRDGEENNVLSNPSALTNGETSAYRFDNAREDDVNSAEAGIRTSFDTGSISHRATLSGSAFSLESANAYAFSSFAGFPGSLYNPVAVTMPAADFFVGGVLSAPLVTEESETSSVAIADMIGFMDDSLLVTLGLRQQNLETRTFDYNTGTKLAEYDEGRLTPIAGIVYKASEQLSIYANYIEGLQPGEIAPTTSGGSPVVNAGEVFEPFQTEQYEAGIKYDAGTLGGTLSLFSTSKPSSYVENNVFDTYGEQRNRGVELSVFGQPMDNLRLLGGLTLISAEMTSTEGGFLEGNDVVGVPDTQLNVNVEWDVEALSGLTLEARTLYTSEQYADAANTVKVDAWTRFDLGARYTTMLNNKEVTIRARLQNATDSDDWVSVGGFPGANYLVLGNPRTFMLSASVNF